MNIELQSMIAYALAESDLFAARVKEDEECGGAMICSTPWAVALKGGPVRAALIEGSVLRTVEVRAHLCGFTCMDKARAERVAALLNEEGDYFEPVLVSEMAAACRDHYLGLAARMEELLAANG